MISKKFVIFIVCLIAPLFVGFLGSFITMPAIPTWYESLQKPPISPPNWIFGPVWTVLYIIMGVASYLVFQKGINRKNRIALNLYSAQLLLNFLWSFIFFGMSSIIGGFIVIVALWILILMTIKEFSKFNTTSGLLLWPYLAWVTFASILNFSFLLLNP